MLKIYLKSLKCLILISIVPAILSAQDMIIGKGNGAGVIVTSSDESSQGDATLSTEGYLPNLNAASRFLSQASFGPNFEEIDALSTQGIENWIDAQFNTPRPFSIMDASQAYADRRIAAGQDLDGGIYNYYGDFAWWQYMMQSPDVLRQRVALALMEFFVISRFSSFGDNAYALGTYYDMLMDGAFTNYRDLLDSVTYHSAMGQYLTFMNNSRTDTIYNLDWSNGWPPDTISIQYVFPDENYAREVMQLFSIGLCHLNMDGTCMKTVAGIDSSTYDNEDIKEFSKIFTGFSYGDNMQFGYGPGDWRTTYYTPMQIYNDYHEPGEKHLLNGFTVPNRVPVDGHADVKDALDNIFSHPNVGIFFGKFLIQRLVTSNPSGAYVERVARAFNGETHYGSTRGDMRALIKAILLDDEARSCDMSKDANHGKLREPFIRYLQLAKAFDFNSPSGNLRNALSNVFFFVQQKQFSSPSVFNFFQSDYQPIGAIEDANKVAPEFQITNTQTITGYLNGLNEWVEGDIADQWGLYNGEHYNSYMDEFGNLDYSDELALTDDARLPQLVERLNLILAHGKMSQGSIDAIVDLLKLFDYDDSDCPSEHAGNAADIADCEEDKERTNLRRVYIAVYMVMSSPEYLINR